MQTIGVDLGMTNSSAYYIDTEDNPVLVTDRGKLRPEDWWLLAEASPRYALAPENPESLARIQKLKALAEKAKMDLTVSTVDTITHQGIFLDDTGEMVDVDLTVDRATFNRLIGDFVSRTMEETSRVLAASGLIPEQIDRVILVGGSTRMPIIREELKKRFPCPILMADPELIVARGAALKARQLGRAIVNTNLRAPRLTKPIFVQCGHGLATLFPEGMPLPAHASFEWCRETSDRIVIPIFEGERWLTNLIIAGLAPDLPGGAVIDIQVLIDEDYDCRAKAIVRMTGQAVPVELKIEKIEIPPVEELDRQLEDALEEFYNDIAAVRNPEMRARLSRQARKLEASYRKAKAELDQDRHHLYTLVGALRKLLIDVRRAHDLLAPPREDFDGLLRSNRGFAGRLDERGVIPRQDALDKITALERSGCDAWEQQDAELWNSVIAELRKLREDLARALQPPPPDPRQLPPERFQAELLAWLGNLRAHLEARFGGELYDIERSVRLIDLKSRESAREELLAIADERLKPLDFRIARFLREQSGKTAADGSTGASAYF
jgi:hypothetical protein